MQRRPCSWLRVAVLAALCCGLARAQGMTQTSAPVPPPTAPAATTSTNPSEPVPNAPTERTLQQRPQRTSEEIEDARVASLQRINGRPYVQPTHKEQFKDYLRDSYGLPAFARSTVRTLYNQAQDGPSGWGQDFPGFMQRFGSNVAITAIDGNVRYGMETIFHEDMRYIPCHGCSIHRKVENALLAEVTARHDTNGHRFFTITPTLSDMSGPMIANSVWIPGHTTINGFYGSRLIFAYRIGGHLFTEFVLERRHHDPKLPD